MFHPHLASPVRGEPFRVKPVKGEETQTFLFLREGQEGGVNTFWKRITEDI